MKDHIPTNLVREKLARRLGVMEAVAQRRRLARHTGRRLPKPRPTHCWPAANSWSPATAAAPPMRSTLWRSSSAAWSKTVPPCAPSLSPPIPPSSPPSATTMASSASLPARLKHLASRATSSSPSPPPATRPTFCAPSSNAAQWASSPSASPASTGGKMPPLCDYCLRIPSGVTMYIQQAHLALEHIFSLLVERRYFARRRCSEQRKRRASGIAGWKPLFLPAGSERGSPRGSRRAQAHGARRRPSLS